jgi:hypothetical protein
MSCISHQINEMSSACGMHGRERNAYRILMGKSQRKGPPRSPRLRRENNNEIGARVAWTGLRWLR